MPRLGRASPITPSLDRELQALESCLKTKDLEPACPFTQVTVLEFSSFDVVKIAH